MTQAAAKARIKFLVTSATYYSQSAPATSAHLMLQCGSVTTGNDIPIKILDSQKACGTCGTILVPGWNSRTSVNPHPKSKNHRLKLRNGAHHTPGERAKMVMTQCLVCRRSTSSHLQYVAAHGSTRKNALKSQAILSGKKCIPTHGAGSTGSVVQEPQTPVPSNLASKKRARARKQTGLQEMLQKSKAAGLEALRPTLDLMDIMKLA
jgi:ribonuclease MRP protein subunit SNM1